MKLPNNKYIFYAIIVILGIILLQLVIYPNKYYKSSEHFEEDNDIRYDHDHGKHNRCVHLDHCAKDEDEVNGMCIRTGCPSYYDLEIDPDTKTKLCYPKCVSGYKTIQRDPSHCYENCPKGYKISTDEKSCVRDQIIYKKDSVPCTEPEDVIYLNNNEEETFDVPATSSSTAPPNTNPDRYGVRPVPIYLQTRKQCPRGYTLYTDDMCYENCPVGYIDNKTECKSEKSQYNRERYERGKGISYQRKRTLLYK
jgi:hypothetical protein